MASRSYSAALSVAALLVISGCNSSSSSKSRNTTVLRSSGDGFPGGPVELNYLADDGRAFSNSNQLLVRFLNVSWNVSNGQAIGLFTTQTFYGSVTRILLYAAWFDGTAWHKPVEIRGQSEDVNANLGATLVVWLNTAGLTNTNALARDGDAIVLYMRSDTNSVAPVNDDPNVRVYGTYFDVSEANLPGAGNINGGFNTLATIVDFDNQIVASDTDFNPAGAPGDNDPNVTAIAVASDSLRGSHTFGAAAGAQIVDSGDPTTFVHLLYRKDPTSGDPTPATIEGSRWWSVPFDLNGTSNAIPAATVASVIPLGAAIDTPNQTEIVSQVLTVHNGHVFATVSQVVQAPGGLDTPLIAMVFSPVTPLPTVLEVSSTRQDDSADVAVLPPAAHVYGADHGSASTLFFFEETGFQDNNALGARAQNRDIMLGELRVDAAGATTIGVGSPLEIDGLTGTVDPADGADGDGIVIRNGINGAVSAGSLRTRINRTGTAIVAIWLQHNTDLTDIDPADATRETALPNFVPFVTVVQTRTAATDARTLALSVPAAGPQRSGALESTAHTDVGLPDQTQLSCANLKFQEGLAGGQATSQTSPQGANFALPCDRGASFQGNHLRMSWLYTQGSDQTPGGDLDNTVLFLNGLTMVLPATPAPPTFTLTNLAGVEVEELDDGYGIALGSAVAVDAGDASTSGTPPAPTAAAGRVLVFFPSNGNNELENVAASFLETRIYVKEQAATGGVPAARTLVSTVPASTAQANANQVRSLRGLTIVPVNANTVTAPNHTGRRVHLYWIEDRDVPGTGGSSALRLASRSYDQFSTVATPAVALSGRFGPELAADPTFIDNPSSGSLMIYGVPFTPLFLGRNGNTVGVYFDEDLHLYYQETSGNGVQYLTTQGVIDPAHVDSDPAANFALGVEQYNIFFPPRGDNLPRSQAAFSRFDVLLTPVPPGPLGDGRLFIRVHD